LDRVKIAIAADGGTDFQVFSYIIEKYNFLGAKFATYI